MADRAGRPDLLFCPVRLVDDAGRAAVDRLQRPYEHGLLPCPVRPGRGRSVRASSASGRITWRARSASYLRRRDPYALQARVDGRRAGPRSRSSSSISTRNGCISTWKSAMPAEGWVAATCENLSLHVDMATRKVTPFPDDILANLAVMKAGACAPRAARGARRASSGIPRRRRMPRASRMRLARGTDPTPNIRPIRADGPGASGPVSIGNDAGALHFAARS